MSIRARAKALFKSRSKSDKDSQLSKSSGQNSSTERWPSNVYKPGEPMPRPKYRAPPKKEHKEKLEAFSFPDAWRKKSFQSQYSPMGTRAPSRRNSYRHITRKSSWASLGRKNSGKSGETNAALTVPTGDSEKSSVRQREHMGVAIATTLTTEAEVEGDDDVHNVGMSRVQSHDHRYQPLSRPRSAEIAEPGTTALSQTLSTAYDHRPFTEQELALALSRTHLDDRAPHLVVPAHS